MNLVNGTHPPQSCMIHAPQTRGSNNWSDTVPFSMPSISGLAQNPPVWLDALGPVPGRSDRADQWRRVAAEVAAHRRTYNIADSEPELLPKTHLKKSEVAQGLRNRAAALHKHSELTTRAPMPEEGNAETAQQKKDQAVTTLSPTSAEAKLAQLRRLSQGAAQPATEQENTVPAEPEHEMSGPKPTPTGSRWLRNCVGTAPNCKMSRRTMPRMTSCAAKDQVG